MRIIDHCLGEKRVRGDGGYAFEEERRGSRETKPGATKLYCSNIPLASEQGRCALMLRQGSKNNIDIDLCP